MFRQTLKTFTRAGLRGVLAIVSAASLLLVNASAVKAVTEVGGPIISDTTWTAANSPYIVIESIDVWAGVTLTIEPGVIVKFNSEKKLQVSGGLIAQGTATNPITFTSNQASPAPGDWGNIEFTSTAITTTADASGNYISGSILQYCVVEYGGYDVHDTIDARSLLIDHCTVQNNDARGIKNLGTETAPSWIIDNTVVGNSVSTGYGGGIYAEYSTVINNTVSRNSAGYSGGGIYTENSTVMSNTVNNNQSSSGNGIYAEYSTVMSNTVSNNWGNGSGGGIRASCSTVISNAINGNSAKHGGGVVAHYSTVMSNTVSNNEAKSYGGGIYASDSTVTMNTISENSAVSGGGIYALDYSTVTSNIVSRNSVNEYGGGIYVKESTVADTIVSSNTSQSGGGIYAINSNIMSNTVVANDVFGSGAKGAGVQFLGSYSSLLYNTVVDNSGPSDSVVGGLEIYGTPQVHYNNFYGNEPYDVTIISSSDISGTNNYWGTTASVDILAQIYDWYDDSSRGKFLYVPYLQEPDEDSPLPPPTNLAANFQDDSAILSWNAHPSFASGWGYKVYYDTDSSLPPYEGAGLNEGDAPIDVSSQTNYTLTGLDPNNNYYFAVTTYDNLGHESWYTNVVYKQGGYWVYLPVVLR